MLEASTFGQKCESQFNKQRWVNSTPTCPEFESSGLREIGAYISIYYNCLFKVINLFFIHFLFKIEEAANDNRTFLERFQYCDNVGIYPSDSH